MPMQKADYILFTDGGARGNPGPAGSGAVIKDAHGVVLKKAHRALGHRTNNYAEYVAIILALETLKKIVPEKKREAVQVEVRMDSQLAQRQLSGEYQIKEETLWPLFIKIWNMRVADFPNIRFVHIPREENKEADEMSNLAMDESERGGTGEQTLF